MTDVQTARASSHNELQWQTIDWEQVYRNVRRLQACIIQVIQAKR